MSLVSKVQRRVHEATAGLFANWLPSDQVEVGDYGTMRNSKFVRDGNLRNWGMTFEVEVLPKVRGSLEYSRGAKLSVGANAKAHIGLGEEQGSIGATATIEFSGEGAILYHLKGLTTERLKDSRKFFEQLAQIAIARPIPLSEKAVIVVEVRKADKATIVVSEKDKGQLKVTGDFPVTGDGVLANAKAGLTIAGHLGEMFKWLGTDGAIPLIDLVRPKFRPPFSRQPADGLLTYLRGRFNAGGWGVRDINVGSYESEGAKCSVMATFPKGGTVLMEVERLTLNEAVQDDIEDTWEIAGLEPILVTGKKYFIGPLFFGDEPSSEAGA